VDPTLYQSAVTFRGAITKGVWSMKVPQWGPEAKLR